jgi:metal-responsive CopG/Arc/MetJ family transcriptional regulator
MITMISLPDPLYQSAEALAVRLKLSRNGLFAKAVESYVYAHETGAVTRRLNEIYAEQATGIPKDLQAAQLSTLEDEGW